MSLNHHILAKTTTDAVLEKFKNTEWNYANGHGKSFYRVGTTASFPSPDATFYDPDNDVLASFEFKPPTETKRGILTGVGQSIAYLQECSISYLVAPQRLEDYNLGGYLTDLYSKQLNNKIPVGLILYDNNNPTKVSLVQNIDSISKTKGEKHSKPKTDRFWAKHQDLPIPLFHLILHCYYLKKTGMIKEEPFAYCFRKMLIPENVLKDFQAVPVNDISGNPIITLGGRKKIMFLEKKLAETADKTKEERLEILTSEIDTDFVGDNYYNSIRKNYVTFLKHIQVIDSENNLTESGFKLYHLGLVNGPASKIFYDYFTKEILTTGHHLDLIFDFDVLKQKEKDFSVEEVFKQLEVEYENKGYLKRNPKRKVGSEIKVKFLKYERILWKALGLIDKNNAIQWKKITEICSLPEL